MASSLLPPDPTHSCTRTNEKCKYIYRPTLNTVSERLGSMTFEVRYCEMISN